MNCEENAKRADARAGEAVVIKRLKEVEDGCRLVQRGVVVEVIDFRCGTDNGGVDLEQARFRVGRVTECRTGSRSGAYLEEKRLDAMVSTSFTK